MLFRKLWYRLVSKWVVCGLIPDGESVRYGLYFSYPVYISIVTAGVFLVDPYLLLATTLVAFLAIKLPMHPFDYLYNYTIARFIGTRKIPGRGSELQVNSFIAVLFNLVVVGLILSKVTISFTALAIIYAVSSVFIIMSFFMRTVK